MISLLLRQPSNMFLIGREQKARVYLANQSDELGAKARHCYNFIMETVQVAFDYDLQQ